MIVVRTFLNKIKHNTREKIKNFDLIKIQSFRLRKDITKVKPTASFFLKYILDKMVKTRKELRLRMYNYSNH